MPVQWRPKRLGQEEPGAPWGKRFNDAEKSCKQHKLKLRVDLRKEGEICQAGSIKGPMTASRDLKANRIKTNRKHVVHVEMKGTSRLFRE